MTRWLVRLWRRGNRARRWTRLMVPPGASAGDRQAPIADSTGSHPGSVPPGPVPPTPSRRATGDGRDGDA